MKQVWTISVLAVAAAAAALAAPPKPGPGSSKPVPRPTMQAVPAIPDLYLSEVRLDMQHPNGTMPGGQTCWVFGLQAVFTNIGPVKAGPFKVVWEVSDTENGTYALACQACTEDISEAKPNVGMLPPPRVFNNCSGPRWYRVWVDRYNAVRESNEGNNTQKVHF